MAADDALIQAMRELWIVSYGSDESFITVDHIPVMCCNLRYSIY